METKTKTKTRSSLAETLFACFAIRKMQLNCFVSEVTDAKSKAQWKWTERKQHTQEVHYISQLPIGVPFSIVHLNIIRFIRGYNAYKCYRIIDTQIYTCYRDTSTIVHHIQLFISQHSLTHTYTHTHPHTVTM